MNDKQAVPTTDPLDKAMYIGPRGGKWANAKHTIPWTPEHGGHKEVGAQAHLAAKEKSHLPKRGMIGKDHKEALAYVHSGGGDHEHLPGNIKDDLSARGLMLPKGGLTKKGADTAKKHVAARDKRESGHVGHQKLQEWDGKLKGRGHDGAKETIEEARATAKMLHARTDAEGNTQGADRHYKESREAKLIHGLFNAKSKINEEHGDSPWHKHLATQYAREYAAKQLAQVGKAGYVAPDGKAAKTPPPKAEKKPAAEAKPEAKPEKVTVWGEDKLFDQMMKITPSGHRQLASEARSNGQLAMDAAHTAMSQFVSTAKTFSETASPSQDQIERLRLARESMRSIIKAAAAEIAEKAKPKAAPAAPKPKVTAAKPGEFGEKRFTIGGESKGKDKAKTPQDIAGHQRTPNYVQQHGEHYVDGDFVNVAGKLGHLKHEGFGDFALKMGDKEISFERTGNSRDGFVGREHKMRGDAAAIKGLLDKMGLAKPGTTEKPSPAEMALDKVGDTGERTKPAASKPENGKSPVSQAASSHKTWLGNQDKAYSAADHLDGTSPYQKGDTLSAEHKSPETAYVVGDYPYGRSRTEKRYWVETNKNGSRMVGQTMNPRTGRWNAPKKSTYSSARVMNIDEKGHVGSAAWEFGYNNEHAQAWKDKYGGMMSAHAMGKLDSAIEYQRRTDAGESSSSAAAAATLNLAKRHIEEIKAQKEAANAKKAAAKAKAAQGPTAPAPSMDFSDMEHPEKIAGMATYAEAKKAIGDTSFFSVKKKEAYIKSAARKAATANRPKLATQLTHLAQFVNVHSRYGTDEFNQKKWDTFKNHVDKHGWSPDDKTGAPKEKAAPPAEAKAPANDAAAMKLKRAAAHEGVKASTDPKTVKLSLGDGVKEVASTHTAGQWAVHKGVKSAWSVTHKPSGFGVSHHDNAEDAKAMANKLHKEAPEHLSDLGFGKTPDPKHREHMTHIAKIVGR